MRYYTIAEFLFELDKIAPDRGSWTDANSVKGYIKRGKLQARLKHQTASSWGRYEISESEVERIKSIFKGEINAIQDI